VSNCALCDSNERNNINHKINCDNEAAKFKEYGVDSHEVIMGIRAAGFYSTEYKLHAPDLTSLNIWIACKVPKLVFYSCGIGCGNMKIVIA